LYIANKKFDITLVTCADYLTASDDDEFKRGVIYDDALLAEALQKRGFKVTRKKWDEGTFNWADTRYAVFRTPWDYFSRYDEFLPWFENTAKMTRFINPPEIIKWNIDKHYLVELEKAGINIPPTIFIEPGDKGSLAEFCSKTHWKEFILKPAVSGGAWHTYQFNKDGIAEHEKIFGELIKARAMVLQQFQDNITSEGEISFLLFGGKYSHAVIKKATANDYRVQANLGGTVEDYYPSRDEIQFAENVIQLSPQNIVYARVDVMHDNNDELCLMELEIFEPELWMRRHPPAVNTFAELLSAHISR
jgi:glutathione synthase/RimK-type ligase-like ATP-grasp enzyme